MFPIHLINYITSLYAVNLDRTILFYFNHLIISSRVHIRTTPYDRKNTYTSFVIAMRLVTTTGHDYRQMHPIILHGNWRKHVPTDLRFRRPMSKSLTFVKNYADPERMGLGHTLKRRREAIRETRGIGYLKCHTSVLISSLTPHARYGHRS